VSRGRSEGRAAPEAATRRLQPISVSFHEYTGSKLLEAASASTRWLQQDSGLQPVSAASPNTRWLQQDLGLQPISVSFHECTGSKLLGAASASTRWLQQASGRSGGAVRLGSSLAAAV